MRLEVGQRIIVRDEKKRIEAVPRQHAIPDISECIIREGRQQGQEEESAQHSQHQNVGKCRPVADREIADRPSQPQRGYNEDRSKCRDGGSDAQCTKSCDECDVDAKRRTSRVRIRSLDLGSRG